MSDPGSDAETNRGLTFEGSDRELLVAVKASVIGLSTRLDTAIIETRRRTRATRWAVVLLGVALLAAVVIGGVVFVTYRDNRTASRNRSACDTRSGFVDLANAGNANPNLVLDAIHNYDRRIADRGIPPCGGISLCKDGFYSQSVGQGSCSHHGGQLRILIPGP